MTMPEDFCAFILTHGRPDRVLTYATLLRSGYAGRVYIVIDDEDQSADAYRERFGDKVLSFCKSDVAQAIDEGDNFDDRRAIIYARNACFDLAGRVGCRYFIQLDDDYDEFRFRGTTTDGTRSPRVDSTLEDVFLAVLEFYKSVPMLRTVALAQGGDFLGGCDGRNNLTLKRKAMNSFFCDTQRRFQFFGRINEDVNTYVTDGRRGELFLTVMSVSLNQLDTQSRAGGMSDLYLDAGTYVKSFYSVMYAPSCVKVGDLGDHRSPHYRIHHAINWNRTAPRILDESWCKRLREVPHADAR